MLFKLARLLGLVTLFFVGSNCSEPTDEKIVFCGFSDGFSGVCPDDMAHVPGTDCCIDRYEASINERGIAYSKAGVLPTTGVRIDQAEDACKSAEKELCTGDICEEACTAGGERLYPYGNVYDPTACSGEDSTRALVPTGSLESCEGGIAGVFDMSGNAIELVAPLDEGSFHTLRGGMYLNGEGALSCSTDAVIDDPSRVLGTGLRCCSVATSQEK